MPSSTLWEAHKNWLPVEGALSNSVIDDPASFGLHGKKVQAKNLKEEPLEIFCKNFYQKENYEFCEYSTKTSLSGIFQIENVGKEARLKAVLIRANLLFK